MEIRELISFYHVGRLRSLSKAAQHLQIGQPTVTTHLQRLEKEFGVSLFDRIMRPIQLTSDGLIFYELAKPIVEGIAKGLETLKLRMDYPEHRGSFVIGAYPDVVLHHLPPVVKAFRAEFPQIQIKLVARSHFALLEMVSAGDLDIALGNRPEPEARALDFRHLFDSEPVMLTPLGHELLRRPDVTLEDIAGFPLILLGPESYARRTLERALKAEGLHYDIVLEMDIMEMVKRYVEIGMGIAVTYDHVVQPEDSERMGIRTLTGTLPSSQMGLITLRGKFLSKSVRNFMDAVAAGLGPRPLRYGYYTGSGEGPPPPASLCRTPLHGESAPVPSASPPAPRAPGDGRSGPSAP